MAIDKNNTQQRTCLPAETIIKRLNNNATHIEEITTGLTHALNVISFAASAYDTKQIAPARKPTEAYTAMLWLSADQIRIMTKELMEVSQRLYGLSGLLQGT